ncbi:glycosylphosphatidylinositol transamidase, partial [Stagonosporopsis vannaccii]
LARVPPYLAALCLAVGLAWLLALPRDDSSRTTYVSENALLPGQVHTYFGGSEHNVFRAYRQEVWALRDAPAAERSQQLGALLRAHGLKAATQKYAYPVSNRTVAGENVYAVLQGPRADATEALVLAAAWTNMAGDVNTSGVALVLTLARYFKRWSLWSKDLVFLLPGDSTVGPQAWVDAYHDAHDARYVESLPLKSGALQAAVAVDYPAGPWGHRYDKLHVVYDGTNGQLPNLDLFNTAVQIASGQMGIGCAIQRMFDHRDSYPERLQTMLRGMLSQALGHATGPHSAFIPYHVDAITLSTVGDGWHDEMSLGKTIESLFRSLNNLLEHLHQSFFFYLLIQANRFISIGTYLPSAMLIAVSFSITSIGLWVASGRSAGPVPNPAATASTGNAPTAKPATEGSKEAANTDSKGAATDGKEAANTDSKEAAKDREGAAEDSKEAATDRKGAATDGKQAATSDATPPQLPAVQLVEHDGARAIVPLASTAITERPLFLPLVFVLTVHTLSLIPLYMYNTWDATNLGQLHIAFANSTTLVPLAIAWFFSELRPLTYQEVTLIQSLSLLLLGMFLAALATLNFSQSVLIGILASPLSFMRKTDRTWLSIVQLLLLAALNPTMVATWGSALLRADLHDVLVRAALGWAVSGLWTQVTIWLVWFPAWVVAAVVVAGGPLEGGLL